MLFRRGSLKIRIVCLLLCVLEDEYRDVTSLVTWFRLFLQERNKLVKQGKSKLHPTFSSMYDSRYIFAISH